MEKVNKYLAKSSTIYQYNAGMCQKRLKFLGEMLLFGAISFFFCSCGQKPAFKRHTFEVYMREDWMLSADYSGTGMENYTKCYRYDKDGPLGPFNLELAGMHLPPGGWYTTQTTQYNDAYVVGQVRPLDTNWDYFSGDFKIDSKVQIQLIFSGFSDVSQSDKNTNDLTFNFPPGTTNIHFKTKLLLVYDKPNPADKFKNHSPSR